MNDKYWLRSFKKEVKKLDGNRERILDLAKHMSMEVDEEIVFQPDGECLGHYHAGGFGFHSDAYVVRYDGNGHYAIRKIHSDWD